ncbi:MAG: hypothetical protein V1648_01355 [Candidatus Aenigmatarchaeota archaeon]
MNYVALSSLVIDILNIVVVGMLFYVYIKNYRLIRSRYNLGLVVFSLIFLLQNIVITHLSFFAWPASIGDAVMLDIITINFIELVGMATLLYITWK